MRHRADADRDARRCTLDARTARAERHEPAALEPALPGHRQHGDRVASSCSAAVAAPRLPLAFLPEVDFPGLEINIPYPNALPAQVEEEITRPAEEALATLSRVRRINSWSSANSANIYVQFDWGEDIGPLRVEAREKLDRIRDQLPADVDLIQVNSFRSSDIPVLECRIAADRDLSRDYELLNRHVADPLRRVPGVAKVELYGVEPPQVRIDFRLDGARAPRARRRRACSSGSTPRTAASTPGSCAAATRTWPLRVVNQFAQPRGDPELPGRTTRG